MNRPHQLSKLTTNPLPKNKSKKSSSQIFGPSLKESKPLQVKCGHIKKLIHYDCSKKQDDSEDDIPDENEVYVKENLLQNTTEENENNSPDDDFSIVNINMSRLLSLSNNSNSKNTSDNANVSKENNKEKKNPKEFLKKNNGSFNKSKGGEISSGNGSIESNNPNNITNNNNSNSNNTNSNSNSISNNLSNNNNNNNNNGHLSKNSITAKRKKFYDKLMKKDKKVLKVNNIPNDPNQNKIFETDQFDALKNIPNNNSASNNIKITNNTNIILNVKSGTKSLDIRALNNNTNNDIMMRDLRKLHIITQKAICSISNINPLLDNFDNLTEANIQRNYLNNNKILNNKRPIKELLINDNTDYGINQLLINNYTIDKKYDCGNNPNININFNNNKPTSSQIINIININGGNYSMDQTKKIILKNIPRSDLASIKESPYDTQYITKPPYIQRKGIKNKQYEFDTNTYNVTKKGKNKINKLPDKKYSHNNWHGNTINTASTKNESGSNKGAKKYIEHLKKKSNGKSNDNNYNFRKNIFIESNKMK